jgi:CheY-like chemotaxis protein
MMPVMNGAEFRARQLADPSLSQIPVLALSAAHDVADQAQTLKCAGFVTKPVEFPALIDLVRRYCGPPTDRRRAAPSIKALN